MTSPSSPSSSSLVSSWSPPFPSECDQCVREEVAMEHRLFQSSSCMIPCCLTCTCSRRQRASLLNRANKRWRRCATCLTVWCLFIFGVLVYNGMMPDGYGFVYPCMTRALPIEVGLCDSESNHPYACLQSYRVMEWQTTEKDLVTGDTRTVWHTQRVPYAGHSCQWSGKESSTCNRTSPILVDDQVRDVIAHNISETCWLDIDSGTLVNVTPPSLADAERRGDNPAAMAIQFAIFVALALCACGMWRQLKQLPYIYDDMITATRDIRHSYHNDEYRVLSTFLMGMHHRCGGPALRAFHDHPHYDPNLTHLICQFVDDSVPEVVDGHLHSSASFRVDVNDQDDGHDHEDDSDDRVDDNDHSSDHYHEDEDDDEHDSKYSYHDDAPRTNDIHINMLSLASSSSSSSSEAPRMDSAAIVADDSHGRTRRGNINNGGSGERTRTRRYHRNNVNIHNSTNHSEKASRIIARHQPW